MKLIKDVIESLDNESLASLDSKLDDLQDIFALSLFVKRTLGGRLMDKDTANVLNAGFKTE